MNLIWYYWKPIGSYATRSIAGPLIVCCNLLYQEQGPKLWKSLWERRKVPHYTSIEKTTPQNDLKKRMVICTASKCHSAGVLSPVHSSTFAHCSYLQVELPQGFDCSNKVSFQSGGRKVKWWEAESKMLEFHYSGRERLWVPTFTD